MRKEFLVNSAIRSGEELLKNYNMMAFCVWYTDTLFFSGELCAHFPSFPSGYGEVPMDILQDIECCVVYPAPGSCGMSTVLLPENSYGKTASIFYVYFRLVLL